MVDVQTISVVIAAASVVFGVIAWVLQNRENKEINQARLFMQIYDHLYSTECVMQRLTIWNWDWSDFDDYWEKYGMQLSPEQSTKFISFVGRLEGIGVLVKRNLIDPKLVDDLISGPILRTWEKFGPMIIETRERLDWPQHMEWFEYLYFQIKSIAEKQHPELKT